MKIAIVNNCVPFLKGGAELLADALTLKLNDYGHQALLIRIPFRWDPPDKILEHMLACRLLRLSNVDRVIAFKFPAYYVQHENKILWLLHQFRQAYDFWGTQFQGLPSTLEGEQIRDAIRHADNSYLPEARRIYTNSEVTRDRLAKFNGLSAEVLYPPLLSDQAYRSEDLGDFIFAPGRINDTKRQLLLVQALKHCRTPVRLVVAGHPETALDGQRIRDEIAQNNLDDRVEFVDKFISDENKVDWMARCLGCAYLPYDEDSYGYVTLEACLSHRPVITCTDSGGIHALVKDGQTGFIAEPEPKALAVAMDRLHDDKTGARRMGECGFELARGLRISWDSVIETLTK